MSKIVDTLYADYDNQSHTCGQGCTHTHFTNTTNPFTDFGNELFDAALRNIYTERINVKKDIEPNLFKGTWHTLNGAIDTAFGQVEWGQPNFDFVNELKYNTAVFAAFKTHAQQNDIAAQLVDENGNIKTFIQFKKDTAGIIGKYNNDWLKTEYNTAVIRARAAAQWKDFERDADLYPNLMWMPSTSIEKRSEHVAFYGKIWSIVDPFWNIHHPGDLWNCKCSISNTDKAVTGENIKSDYTPPAGLEGNPGKTGALFSDKHPYIAEAGKGVRAIAQKKASEVAPTKEYYKGKKGGSLEIVPQNPNEVKNNLKTYKIMADNGGQYELLKPSDKAGIKSPDALNKKTGELSDAKHPTSTSGKNAIQTSIKDASSQQVGEVVIRLDKNYSVRSIFEGLKAALQQGRAKSIKTVVLIRKGGKPAYFNTDDLRLYFKNKRG
jgi:hypothetical protein